MYADLIVDVVCGAAAEDKHAISIWAIEKQNEHAGHCYLRFAFINGGRGRGKASVSV